MLFVASVVDWPGCFTTENTEHTEFLGFEEEDIGQPGWSLETFDGIPAQKLAVMISPAIWTSSLAAGRKGRPLECRQGGIR